MSDFLVELGTKKTARRVIGRLGLPIPLPQKLTRGKGPWEERPLDDLPALVAQVRRGDFAAAIGHTLAGTGANAFVAGGETQLGVYREAGEAWSRQPKAAPAEPTADLRPHALLFDAGEAADPGELKEMYEFVHAWIRNVRACGRVVILARRAAETSTPAAAAAERGVEGFARSLGREIGKRGATANVIYVDRGAEARLAPVLRWLLSSRSAYVANQALHVSAKIVGECRPEYRRPLDGKAALVTGAARGIGAAIARAFAREGARVIAMDRPSEDAPLSKVAQEIGGVMLACDLTAPDAADAITKLATERFGGLDIIMHNAGVTRDKTLANMDAARWDMVLEINLLALMRVNEALLPILRDGGRVMCMSSVGGIAGNMGQTNYATSKAGVIGYVQAIAPALAGRGVAVNALAPGFIETQMTAAIPFGTREAARRLCCLGQGGLPEDVAEAATFLASPGAAGLCGEVLRVCGGNFIGA
jgi:3-oxoacyl-[acyl-carrier protein] reductase